MYFLPSQSVNDLRYHDGDGSVMGYIRLASDVPGSVAFESTITWTAP